MGPWLKVSSDRLVKLGIEPAIPGLKGKWFIRYTTAAPTSKAVVLLFLFFCFMYLPLFVGVLCSSLFWYALLYVLSSFAILLTRKRKLVALLLLL